MSTLIKWLNAIAEDPNTETWKGKEVPMRFSTDFSRYKLRSISPFINPSKKVDRSVIIDSLHEFILIVSDNVEYLESSGKEVEKCIENDLSSLTYKNYKEKCCKIYQRLLESSNVKDTEFFDRIYADIINRIDSEYEYSESIAHAMMYLLKTITDRNLTDTNKQLDTYLTNMITSRFESLDSKNAIHDTSELKRKMSTISYLYYCNIKSDLIISNIIKLANDLNERVEVFKNSRSDTETEDLKIQILCIFLDHSLFCTNGDKSVQNDTTILKTEVTELCENIMKNPKNIKIFGRASSSSDKEHEKHMITNTTLNKFNEISSNFPDNISMNTFDTTFIENMKYNAEKPQFQTADRDEKIRQRELRQQQLQQPQTRPPIPQHKKETKPPPKKMPQIKKTPHITYSNPFAALNKK